MRNRTEDFRAVLGYLMLRVDSGIHATREEMMAALRISDRRVRRALRQIDLESDWVVMADPAGGYRLSDDPEDADVAIAPLASRVERLEARIAALELKRSRLRGGHQRPLLLSGAETP